MEIEGVCPIVDTPFAESGEIRYTELEELVDRLAGSDVNSLAVFGFASEYYTLSDRERQRMTEIVVDGCEGYNTNSIVSITPHATHLAIEEAKFASRAGADALMVLPPHVRLSSPAEIRDHIAKIARSVSIPVVVQYAPEGDGVSMPPEELARLYRDVANVEYFKIEARPPGKYLTSLLEQTDGCAKVLVGNAGFEMIEAFDRGAIGVMPASAMYDIYLEIHDLYRQGDCEAAVELHGDLLQMLNLIRQVGIPFEKEILARRGLVESAHCREPIEVPDEYQYDRFDHIYETYIRPNFSAESDGDDIQ